MWAFVPFMTTLCETHNPAGYEYAVKTRIAQRTRLKKNITIH